MTAAVAAGVGEMRQLSGNPATGIFVDPTRIPGRGSSVEERGHGGLDRGPLRTNAALHRCAMSQVQPAYGDWFVFAEAVCRYAEHYPPESPRRAIVVGMEDHVRIPVRGRSSKHWTDGEPSPPHHTDNDPPTCGASGCRLDEQGWVDDKQPPKKVPPGEFTTDTFNCHEPDDDLIERVMRIEYPQDRNARTRRGRGR